MSVYIENETKKAYNFNYEELINKVIDTCLGYINCPYEACVNVTLVDSNAIHEINKEYRNIDSATDVLSFPMIEYDKAGDFAKLEDNSEDYFDPDSGELVLGDIILCVDKIASQAEEYGHSEMREMAFLIAHSMFHLFGFDHMEDGERLEMENMQEEILNKLGITREKGLDC